MDTVNKSLSDINKDRFHLVYGICMEAMCSPLSTYPHGTVETCIHAVSALLDSPFGRSCIVSKKVCKYHLWHTLFGKTPPDFIFVVENFVTSPTNNFSQNVRKFSKWFYSSIIKTSTDSFSSIPRNFKFQIFRSRGNVLSDFIFVGGNYSSGKSFVTSQKKSSLFPDGVFPNKVTKFATYCVGEKQYILFVNHRGEFLEVKNVRYWRGVSRFWK